MKNRITLFNIIDLIALTLVIGILTFAYLSISHPKEVSGKPTLLTFVTTTNVETVFPEASKARTIFFNSVNEPVKVINISKTPDNKELNITLLAKGQIETNKYIFHGLRVAIGQKAELHGSFFAQGVIKDIRYEN